MKLKKTNRIVFEFSKRVFMLIFFDKILETINLRAVNGLSVPSYSKEAPYIAKLVEISMLGYLFPMERKAHANVTR